MKERGGIRIRARAVASGTTTAAGFVGKHHCLDFAIQTASDVYWDLYGEVAVMTGGQEEGHSDGRHDGRRGDFRSRAFDLASRNIPPDRRSEFQVVLGRALGPAFRIIDEGTHFHIAYAPPSKWAVNSLGG